MLCICIYRQYELSIWISIFLNIRETVDPTEVSASMLRSNKHTRAHSGPRLHSLAMHAFPRGHASMPAVRLGCVCGRVLTLQKSLE